MKKLPVKILLLIILAYSGLVKLRAQERSLDSLRGVWNDESQSDSNRLMAVRLLSTHSLQTTPDSAFHFSKLMYDYANNRGMKKEMAIALRIEGAYFQGLNNDSFALKCFHKSETLFEDLCDSTGLSDVYISIGITHYQNLQLEAAAIYFAKSLEIKERIGEKRGVAANLTNLGAILNL